MVGQPASIDTRTGSAGIIQGQVSYIAPNVLNDRVTVEIKLQEALPTGARPDLSVEAKIEVARLEDVLYVRKPEFSQENGRLEVFRLHADDESASRSMVEFGRGTLNAMEVISGLQEGDQIIVSGTSRWKTHEQVRLK